METLLIIAGDGVINSATREHSEPAPIDDDGVEIPPLREDSKPAPIDGDGVKIPPPSHNEVRVAIQRLKNNKVAGPDALPTEFFKAGGDELVRSMHQFICRIWLEESKVNHSL